MQKFSRIYLEITNVCNRACAFCPGTKREKRFMSEEAFTLLAKKLRPHTDYLYLHVMGEPLLHPQFANLLGIAGALDFRVIITTNGTLLKERTADILSADCVHKVHISLHGFEANDGGDMNDYVNSCAQFGLQAAKRGILVNYRLWNLDGASTQGLHAQNDTIVKLLHNAYPNAWEENTWGFRVHDGVFVQYGERFDWPDSQAEVLRERGLCYAMRKQLAVLCDGTVVPCCLDSEGTLKLGNLFTEELSDILSSPKANFLAKSMRGEAELSELCKRCGYASRFTKA